MREPPSLDAYSPAGFRVSGVWWSGPLLILDDAPGPWRPRTLAEVTAEDFAAVLAAGVAVSEFVLLGTGAAAGLPSRAVRDAIRGAGLGLEFMSTEAAARTHNILASEGRRFATALLLV